VTRTPTTGAVTSDYVVLRFPRRWLHMQNTTAVRATNGSTPRSPQDQPFLSSAPSTSAGPRRCSAGRRAFWTARFGPDTMKSQSIFTWSLESTRRASASTTPENSAQRRYADQARGRRWWPSGPVQDHLPGGFSGGSL